MVDFLSRGGFAPSQSALSVGFLGLALRAFLYRHYITVEYSFQADLDIE
jgi:hypothetical protein